MARSRKIEPEAAMNAAMAMFWKHGYCNLGTRQLEEETGITRFTLQTTYGGKMALYLDTLDAYLDHFETSGLMQNMGTNLDSIAAFFETRGDPSRMPDISCYGCLVLNSMIEFTSSNAEVNQRVTRYLSMLRGKFRAGLAQSLGSASAATKQNIEQKAETLLGATLGLNVIIRAAEDTGAGRGMATAIASMVREWGYAPAPKSI